LLFWNAFDRTTLAVEAADITTWPSLLQESQRVASPSAISRSFAKAASTIAHAAGKPITFATCCLIVVLWALSGPAFGFSDTWQLIINTGTTIITFLMVFLIQNTQNRDGAAIQAKLDELILDSRAQNRYIGIEELTEEELEELRLKCRERASKALTEAPPVLRSAE
jgi:low affinity Fe/Cu permease